MITDSMGRWSHTMRKYAIMLNADTNQIGPTANALE